MTTTTTYSITINGDHAGSAKTSDAAKKRAAALAKKTGKIAEVWETLPGMTTSRVIFCA